MPGPSRLALLAVTAVAAASALADDAKSRVDATKKDLQKPAAVQAVRARAPRNLDEALRILGARRCDVDFREQPMEDVVTFVGRLGRVNAMVSPEFVRKAQGPLPTVTLVLRDVTLRQVAEFVAKATGSRMTLRDGVLQFTTPEDARGTPVLRVFSIADLTFRVRNFPGPDITLHTGGVRYVQEEESDRESAFDDPEKIVELLRKFTGEGTWDDDDVSISADERKLVVKQYPEVLREISAFLAVLRAAK
jgi:hypothetical protein